MSNIYSKLQAARVEFQNAPLKKSGFNKFANYKYFELADFMPTINKLMEQFKLCSNITFYDDYAELVITNTENIEEKVTFRTPFVIADVKGCNAVQNLGASQTYIRRYLWVNAFEIVESDGIDSVTGKDEEPKTKNINAKQIGEIELLCIELEWDRNECDKWVKGKFKKNIRGLTEQQAQQVINALTAKKERVS